MAQTSYTITEANIGAVLTPADGWITDLRQTQAGPYDMAQWSEGKQQWTKGRFVLRGEREFRDLCCIDTQNGMYASHWAHNAFVWTKASIGYAGGLAVICVPRGSVWELVLSDIPLVRASAKEWWVAAADAGRNFIAPKPGQEQRELEPAVIER
jgi:hypothetical protein